MANLPLAIQVHADDEVAVMLSDASAGAVAAGVTLLEPVAKGHKVAVRSIAAGAPVRKYGFPFGVATTDIPVGAHVHVHNVKSALQGRDAYSYAPESVAPLPTDGIGRIFMGYPRADRRVATRKEIWVIPTVGCVGNLAERIAARAGATLNGEVDAVRAFKHPFGCSQLGDDLGHTRAVLAALAQHPNAFGVLLLGLGCESNQMAALLDTIPPERRGHIRTLGAQAAGDEMAEGLAIIAEMVAAAAPVERQPAPLSALTLGVKCGGSDGFSGLTANPLVGRMSDVIGGAGGQVILTEIPELFGAEHIVMQRAIDAATFTAAAALIQDFKAHFTAAGEGLSDNPSPGNIAGGITTLEEKSLGAVQKGGRVPLVDVARYGGMATRAGLTLLEAPGNDAVSSTALTAAGATVILFTTGRGTPLGFPAPTVKIASNSALAAAKPGWIDFNAGAVLTDGMDAAGAALLDRIIAIASGETTAAERNGEHDIAIWKTGVTL